MGPILKGLLAQTAPGQIPKDYRLLDDWRMWAGIAFILLVVEGPKFAAWYRKRVQKKTDALDDIEVKTKQREFERLQVLEQRADASNDDLVLYLKDQIEDLKQQNQALLRDLLVHREAAHKILKPDPIEQEKGRRLLSTRDRLPNADAPGISQSGVRTLEQQSDVTISEPEDDRGDP